MLTARCTLAHIRSSTVLRDWRLLFMKPAGEIKLKVFKLQMKRCRSDQSGTEFEALSSSDFGSCWREVKNRIRKKFWICYTSCVCVCGWGLFSQLSSWINIQVFVQYVPVWSEELPELTDWHPAWTPLQGNIVFFFLRPYFTCFCFEVTNGTTVFGVGPVLSETAAFSRREIGCRQSTST